VIHNTNSAELSKNSICETIVILYPSNIKRDVIRDEYHAGYQIHFVAIGKAICSFEEKTVNRRRGRVIATGRAYKKFLKVQQKESGCVNS
jgi:hypothetical protein